MIRFACLQARTQTAIAAAALAAAAVLALVTGPRLLHLYHLDIASCHPAGACASATTAFLASYRLMQVFAPPLLLVLPALLGMFWGAPLVARELETGTFRLAWTQSVTRKRWLAVKLAVAGLASTAVAGLLSLVLTWWFSPIDRVQANLLTPSMFGVRGIAPIGYAAFAFALGVTAGALLRRTIPAMAVTLAGFTAARLAVTYYVRPHLFAPLRAVSPLVWFTGTGPSPQPGAGTVSPGDWVLSAQTINGAGKVIGQFGGVGPNGSIGFHVSHGAVSLVGVGPCPNTFPAAAVSSAATRTSAQPPAAFNTAAQECISKLGLRNIVTYQPLSRYWPLQWSETLIFLGLALALAAFCFWRVNRSLT
jgi:hypothetical protein